MLIAILAGSSTFLLKDVQLACMMAVDHSIQDKRASSLSCRRHAERYEAEFWEDMHRLGMKIPEEKNLTRVTEYMEEIIEYIKRIMENGFAYTKDAGSKSENRSVYFDTQAYM